MNLRHFCLAASLFAISLHANAFGDGLLRTLGNMSVTDSSIPCDVQMYNINAFRSELNQLKLNHNCSEIHTRTQQLIRAMDHTNLKLCTAQEAYQLQRWRYQLEVINDESANHPDTYCGAANG